MRIPREALMASLWQARWHLAATFLVAHPVWLLIEWTFRATRLDQNAKSAAEEILP
jgi:hypothetical protein